MGDVITNVATMAMSHKTYFWLYLIERFELLNIIAQVFIEKKSRFSPSAYTQQTGPAKNNIFRYFILEVNTFSHKKSWLWNIATG